MSMILQVLQVEDSVDDAFMVQHALEAGGYELKLQRVETKEAMRRALSEQEWDLVISDYRLPKFSGTEALALLKELGLDLPFILVSGAIGEETATSVMKAGASDYIMKSHLQRLAPAVGRELAEAKTRMERRKALEELKTSRSQLFNAMEMAHLGHWDYDLGTDLFTFNDQFYRLFGTSAEEVGGYTMKSADYCRRFVFPEDIGFVAREIRKSAEISDTDTPRHLEHRVLHPDGKVGYLAVRFFVVKDAKGRTIGTTGVNQDITETKRTEIALRESEKKYRLLAENIADVVWTSGLDFAITYVSPSVEKMFGVPPEIYAKWKVEERFPPESLQRLRSAIAEELAKESNPAIPRDRSRIVEVKGFKADGTSIWIAMNVSFLRDENGKIVSLNGVSRDITARKRNEEEIVRNEERLEGLLRISQHQSSSSQELLDYALEEAIKLTSSKLGYIYLYNDKSEEFTLNTWSREVMRECTIRDPQTVYQLEATGIWGEAVRQARPLIINDFKEPHPQKKGYPDGHAHLERFLTIPVLFGDHIVAVAGVANKHEEYDESDVRQLTLLMDSVWRILENRRTTEALLQTERQYHSIFDNAQEGIFQTNQGNSYLTVNRAMAAMLGYDSPESMIAQVSDISREIYFDPEDRVRLLRTIDSENSVRGFVCRYLRRDGSVIWVSIDEHAVRDAEGTLLRYEGFCEDVTERRASTERLRKALGATIYAVSAAVEARDPYTAGHQSRVAELAQAIGLEIDLPPDRLEGLRLAASIHDLGKLSVPAEILTKPKKLSPIEFELIKIHSQAGYDILKDIEFPWPIARIVLEHHEKIDGSGYPHGLTGESTLLESRILAVADVVESMASYRPYRPALGMEAAMEEIGKQKGRLYDALVVEGCVRLFRDKGFVLK